jgi:hypothetical protein
MKEGCSGNLLFLELDMAIADPYGLYPYEKLNMNMKSKKTANAGMKLISTHPFASLLFTLVNHLK